MLSALMEAVITLPACLNTFSCTYYRFYLNKTLFLCARLSQKKLFYSDQSQKFPFFTLCFLYSYFYYVENSNFISLTCI